MALTKIRGNQQIVAETIGNTEIALDAAIATSKLADGLHFVRDDGLVPFTAPISGVTPTAADHLATKGYVDGVAQSLDIKLSVKVATTSNITLSNVQVIDGVTLAVGDRVLVKNQTDAKDNGIYTVSSGVWARAIDADTSGEVTSGLFTFAEQGTENGNTGWVLSTADPIVLGATALNFTQFSNAGSFISGGGLLKTGNQIDVVSANGGIVVNNDNIALTVAGTTLTVTPAGLKLADLPTGHILVGNALNVATSTAVAGAITIDSSGNTVLGAGVIVDSNISTSAAIALTKLASGTAGQVVLANASGKATYTTIAGDITVNSAGATTIGTSKVVTGMIADGSVTLAKIAPSAAGTLIIGQGVGAVQALTLSGDVTMDKAGVVTTAANILRAENYVARDIPVGTINGVNKDFTLSNIPVAGTEMVFFNGMLQDIGATNDYTIVGNTITLTFAPLNADDKIRVSYFK